MLHMLKVKNYSTKQHLSCPFSAKKNSIILSEVLCLRSPIAVKTKTNLKYGYSWASPESLSGLIFFVFCLFLGFY